MSCQNFGFFSNNYHELSKKNPARPSAARIITMSCRKIEEKTLITMSCQNELLSIFLSLTLSLYLSISLSLYLSFSLSLSLCLALYVAFTKPIQTGFPDPSHGLPMNFWCPYWILFVHLIPLLVGGGLNFCRQNFICFYFILSAAQNVRLRYSSNRYSSS